MINATVASPAPDNTIVDSGIEGGASVISSLPVTSASQKPDVTVAASVERRPTYSRCEVIQPPVPFSIAT